MFKGRFFEFEEEDQEDEVVGENEDLQEHQRAKDTHRKRRIDKEKRKQETEWKKPKSKGKKSKFRNDDEEDYHY